MIFVFFLKQKTAYEMRISDWSSDVCSSDLVTVLIENVTGLEGHLRQFLDVIETVGDISGQLGAIARQTRLLGVNAAIEAAAAAAQIGRASWRARVCTSV